MGKHILVIRNEQKMPLLAFVDVAVILLEIVCETNLPSTQILKACD